MTLEGVISVANIASKEDEKVKGLDIKNDTSTYPSSNPGD